MPLGRADLRSPLQEEHVPHLADLQQLWELDLVSLHCPSVAGEHDLHDTLQPLTRLKGLRSLMIQVCRQCRTYTSRNSEFGTANLAEWLRRET